MSDSLISVLYQNTLWIDVSFLFAKYNENWCIKVNIFFIKCIISSPVRQCMYSLDMLIIATHPIGLKNRNPGNTLKRAISTLFIISFLLSLHKLAKLVRFRHVNNPHTSRELKKGLQD